MTNLAWKLHGACAGHPAPDIWHTEQPGNGWQPRLAKKICAECPVLNQCFEYSIANEEPFGIWAGVTQTQRRRIIQAARRPA